MADEIDQRMENRERLVRLETTVIQIKDTMHELHGSLKTHIRDEDDFLRKIQDASIRQAASIEHLCSVVEKVIIEKKEYQDLMDTQFTTLSNRVETLERDKAYGKGVIYAVGISISMVVSVVTFIISKVFS